MDGKMEGRKERRMGEREKEGEIKDKKKGEKGTKRERKGVKERSERKRGRLFFQPAATQVICND
jgi:hypothetical protein